MPEQSAKPEQPEKSGQRDKSRLLACPVHGCTNKKHWPQHVLCGACWEKLPRAVQRQLAEWPPYDRQSDSYQMAVQAAIDELHSQLIAQE